MDDLRLSWMGWCIVLRSTNIRFDALVTVAGRVCVAEIYSCSAVFLLTRRLTRHPTLCCHSRGLYISEFFCVQSHLCRNRLLLVHKTCRRACVICINITLSAAVECQWVLTAQCTEHIIQFIGTTDSCIRMVDGRGQRKKVLKLL